MTSASGALQALQGGGKPAMAAALAQIETAPRHPDTLALLDAAYGAARAQVVGVTGPPGVGKSTLVARLIKVYRAGQKSVGVIAVDPSSQRGGGALLGDRVRIETDPEDAHTFVRSMAARDRMGGLARLTRPAMVLMRAVYDRVIVETVGVGQAETDIASISDTVVLCVQPGSGDSLQYMKAGIAEIPDIAVVCKADLGRVVDQAKNDLEAALATTSTCMDDWSVPVVMVSALDGGGVDALIRALADHASFLAKDGRLQRRRQEQAEAWVGDVLRDEFGRFGLELAAKMGAGLELAPGASPFGQIDRLLQSLRARLSA